MTVLERAWEVIYEVFRWVVAIVVVGATGAFWLFVLNIVYPKSFPFWWLYDRIF